MSRTVELLSEREGESERINKYIRIAGETKVVCIAHSETSPYGLLPRIKHTLTDVFLPQGYPASVSNDYLDYQIWDTIQAFASSLSGSLSTKAVLEGVGVGSSTSTPLAATIMWLIKDGSGMVGKILFAWLKSGELDADSKKWRFFADILNDCALTLELCGPFLVHSLGGASWLMTAVLCTAGTAKSIVGVAGGATRAALTQHQALVGNLADVSAKDGSQETLVNLIALLTSLWVLPLVDSSFRLTMIAFLLFTFLHVFANYRAVKSVTMDCFNRTRYIILLKHYFLTREVLSVEEVNKREPIVIGTIPCEEAICGHRILLASTIRKEASINLETGLKKFSGKNYAVITNSVTKTTNVIFRSGCKSEDFVESYALVFISAMITSGNSSPWLTLTEGLTLPDVVAHLLKSGIWDDFSQKLTRKGWRADRSLLLPGEWRASW